ncbi:MAG: hypothetical protein J5590_02550 [Clostridia bacterium]|nr:hypothetical protein [Clostridia bacterium]
MNGKTKKFFSLKNFKILKSKHEGGSGSESSGDIVAEAERIIDTYLYRIGYDKKGGKRQKKPWLLEFFLPSFVIAAAVYFVVHFIK